MRGYQKKVVYLKNTGSAVFEEAYFVIKGKADEKSKSSVALVEEANRIIDENVNFGLKKRGSKFNIKSFLIFAIGFLSATAILLLVLLFLRLL